MHACEFKAEIIGKMFLLEFDPFGELFADEEVENRNELAKLCTKDSVSSLSLSWSVPSEVFMLLLVCRSISSVS